MLCYGDSNIDEKNSITNYDYVMDIDNTGHLRTITNYCYVKDVSNQ
jgi:hypothetical protein